MVAIWYRFVGYVAWRFARRYLRMLRRGGPAPRGVGLLSAIALAIAAGALARVRRPR